MKNERVQELIDRIITLLDERPEERRAQNKKFSELYHIKTALATEYAARNGWKLVLGKSYDRYLGDVVTPDEVERPEFQIVPGSDFNLKALKEGKKWAYKRGEDYHPNYDYMDHPYFYRFPGGIAAAIVAHPYGIRDDVETWAESKGLNVHFPDFPSWHCPGGTEIVEFTRRKTSCLKPEY